MSNSSALVRTANGSSVAISAARSLAPSSASRPPMMMIVVDAKNDGLEVRLWMAMPSMTRTSRKVLWYIHSRRTWLPAASSEGLRLERRCANHA